MKLSLIDILLSDAAARAICWTLVHSLWQGILAAGLAGVVIGCTRRLPAALRYNLLVADGLLFLLAAGSTFYYEMGNAAGPVNARLFQAMPSEPASGSMTVLQPEMLSRSTTAGNIMQQTGDYLNAHAGMITLIWLACLSIQLIRLTGGLYRLSRIRRHSIPPPGEYWNERLLALARRLGIGSTVTLLQSQWVKTPSAFGFLKPSILVPLGMLSQLPPDQVETILLHELAHIRRGDYAVNLLLHLTEAIFFFNPGMRWIASLIRREREACCDDIVLAGTPDRNCYLEALVAFTQWAINGQGGGGHSYAVQLGGGKTDLLWRIRRMLNQENKKLQVMEKAILSFGLMALVSVSLISMKGKDGRAATATKVAKPAAAVAPAALRISATVAKADTVPQDKTDTVAQDKQESYSGKRMHKPVPPVAPIAPTAPVKPTWSNGFGVNERAEHAPTLTSPLVYTRNPNPYIESIVADLVENGLIDNVNRFSFTLNAEGLVVNGTRQPDNIFLTFRTKYVIHPKARFIYSQYYTPQGSGSHCEVNIDPDGTSI
jgi:beta-lactamase regulating signal transducer with metallopeptidase domain